MTFRYYGFNITEILKRDLKSKIAPKELREFAEGFDRGFKGQFEIFFSFFTRKL